MKVSPLMTTVIILLFGSIVGYSGDLPEPLPSAEDETTAKHTTPTQFEVVDPDRYDDISNWLSAHGEDLGNTTILSIGFESDPYNPSAKKLAVITLGPDNQPNKKLFPADNTFYQKFTQKKLTVGESEKPASLTDNSAMSTNQGHQEDGRLFFMINTSVRSLYVYPAGFAMATEGADGQVITGLSLLSLGASLYGSYAFSRTLELGYGRVEFMNYGADMGGIWIPTLLQLALLPDSEDGAASIRGYAGMIGFPLGIYIGSKFTFADNYAYGNASIMTNLSRFAPLYGFILPAIFSDLNNSDGDSYLVASSLISMGLIPAGFYVGKKLVGDRDISSGRSIMTLTGSIFGSLTGLAIPLLFESQEPKLYLSTTLLGHIAGTAFGFTYKRDNEYTFSQGMFTLVSTAVGTGVGLAIPLISSAVSEKAYLMAGLIGCWGGFLVGEQLSQSIFEENRHDNRESRVSVSFPGIASLPMLIMSQKFGATHHSSDPFLAQQLTRVPVMDVRF